VGLSKTVANCYCEERGNEAISQLAGLDALEIASLCSMTKRGKQEAIDLKLFAATA